MDSPTAQVEALTRVRVKAASGTAKAIRDRARLSQSEMARALGVDTSTICRWERGIDRPIGAPALAWLALPMGLGAGLQSLMTNVPRYALEAHAGPAALGWFAASHARRSLRNLSVSAS